MASSFARSSSDSAARITVQSRDQDMSESVDEHDETIKPWWNVSHNVEWGLQSTISFFLIFSLFLFYLKNKTTLSSLKQSISTPV